MASSHALWTLGHLSPCRTGRGAPISCISNSFLILTKVNPFKFIMYMTVQWTPISCSRQEPRNCRPYCARDGCWHHGRKGSASFDTLMDRCFPVFPFCRFVSSCLRGELCQGLDLCVAALFLAHAQQGSQFGIPPHWQMRVSLP